MTGPTRTGLATEASPTPFPVPNGALDRLRDRVRELEPRPVKGRVTKVIGTLVHAAVPEVRLGEICTLADPRSNLAVQAEVVGLAGETALLTPIGELTGLSTRTEVLPSGRLLQVPVGPALLGRVLDSLGRPLDGGGPIAAERSYPVDADPPEAMARALVEEPLPLGLRVLDGLLTCGRGQRIGIFGEPGGGKSSLLASLVHGAEADVAVIALIGERGREVREFVERQLGAEGMRRAVVVVATSDRPAMERVKAAYVATAVAEYFRDQGKNVLLLMDSVTRFARAQREIGLAAGEPPTRRGFPPSVFAMLPRLMERAGPAPVGSITAFYTVLVEGDGTLDPIAEETRSILDGHIVLSPKLARAEHYPAIDVLQSRSRVMDAVVSPEHKAAAGRVRQLLARYAELELLLRVGEYKKGADPFSDEAVGKNDLVNAFLRQRGDQPTDFGETVERLRKLAR